MILNWNTRLAVCERSLQTELFVLQQPISENKERARFRFI